MGSQRVGHDWLKSAAVQYSGWLQGLASSEEARRVTDWRRERRSEMVEMKDHQQ